MPYNDLPANANDDGSRPDVLMSTVRQRDPLRIVFAPDTRERITPTTTPPWTSLGQLIVTFPDANAYSGTGVVIGERHILTAAHNVFDHELGGFAVAGVFLPTRDGATIPDRAYIDRVFVTDAYSGRTPSPDAEDYAVIRLSDEIDYPVLRLLAATDEQLDRAAVTVAGYPGDKQPDNTLWSASGNLAAPDDDFLYYQISTFRGESGAPVLLPPGQAAPSIVGVHVAGDRTRQTNFAVRLTAERIRQIQAWMAS